MSEYGDSSAGRVYERLERVFEVGLARIEARLDTQSSVLDEMRERVTRVEERGGRIEALSENVKELECKVDSLDRGRATERGVAAGLGAASGAVLTLIAEAFSKGGQWHG